MLGAGTLFRKQLVLETYFNESVQGLEVGSKVMFRGVMVGNVSRLTFTYAVSAGPAGEAAQAATCWCSSSSSPS